MFGERRFANVCRVRVLLLTPRPSKPAKGAGRPKRDLTIAADQLCDEFASVRDNTPQFSSWFGGNYKANRRNIKRLVDDLAARVSSLDAPERCVPCF